MGGVEREDPQAVERAENLLRTLGALRSNPTDAADAEKNWVAYLAEEPDAVPTKTATLRDAYDLLAWYQFFARDYAGALTEGRSLEPFIAQLNEIRRLHPALQQLRTIHFHHLDNDALLAFSKFDPATGDCVRE